MKKSLFADGMILYIENPKDSTKKLLETINTIKLLNTKSIYKNPLHPYTLTMKSEKKWKKKIPFAVATRIPRNKQESM